MRKTLTFIFMFSFCTLVMAQEVLNELTLNGQLLGNTKAIHATKHLKAGVNDTLSIPFIDDFSYEGPYPDENRWEDQHVYINNDLAIAPISIGVASFDGLDSSGYPYNISASINSSAIADYLTSKPIDLNYNVSDSLYLSFYYQPEGRGNAPEGRDSLVLEFRADDSTWVSMWNKSGFNPAEGDSTFYKVMVPVLNSAFLYKGFQFRFKNYATLSGSIDHWHVDYVYLDKGRTVLDDPLSDVTFVYSPSSMLKEYSAMPWKHYSSAQVATSLSNFIRNNDTIAINTDYQYNILENNVSLATEGGTDNIDAYRDFGYSHCTPDCPSIMNPPVNYTFVADARDSATFVIEHTIKPNNLNDLVSSNDTVRYYQRFYNYYAYDDGTAEAGYGLTASGGALAYQFNIDRQDTLRGIKIYFNPQLKNISSYTFTVAVWADNNGIPGTLLFQDTLVKPVYTKSGPNGFFNYLLNKKDLTLNGKYYVGMIQTLEESLNVGFDKNTNKKDKIFYNIDGVWYNTNFTGALMIRPMFGKNFMIGIDEQKQEKFQKNTFTLYPSPANDRVMINTLSTAPFDIMINDLSGRMVKLEKNLQNKTSIDVADLSAGMYLFTIIADGLPIVKRVVISR